MIPPAAWTAASICDRYRYPPGLTLETPSPRTAPPGGIVRAKATICAVTAARTAASPGVRPEIATVNATAAGGVLATLLILANYSRSLVALFTFVIQLSTLSTLVPYVFCSLAALMKPGGKLVPVLAFVFSMAAIYGAGPEVVFWGFLLLLGGLPIYVVQRIRAN